MCHRVEVNLYRICYCPFPMSSDRKTVFNLFVCSVQRAGFGVGVIIGTVDGGTAVPVDGTTIGGAVKAVSLSLPSLDQG